MANTAPTANLGYGTQSETTIDHANIAMRGMPWYQEQMRAWGQDPGHPTLTKSQSQQLLKQAQANGFVVDEGNMEMDDHGNFNPKGHKLRNTLIVAGLAAATIATMGAAGVFAGATAPAAASMAGVEAGAAAGIDASVAAGTIGTAGLAAPAAAAAFDAAGNFIGDTTISSVGSIAGKAASGLSTADKIATLLGAAGKGVGAATTAAGNDRQIQQNAGLTANAQNISGQSAFESELMNRAKEESAQRSGAAKDVYRASYAANPRVSPFDTTGPPKYSDSYLSTIGNLASQGSAKLAKPSTYDTGAMPALTPYTPIDPKNVAAGTGTTPSSLSKIGDWLGPGMTIADLIAQLAKK